MICWSCEKDAGGDATFCPHCKAIQPPAAGDHFAVLGLPKRFSIDLAAAEARYKDLARQVHPDRFARADPRARRAAMQQTVKVNEAWRDLRDPYRRAEYLLLLGGIDAAGEESVGPTKTSGGGAKTRVPVPQDLLMEMLEKREELSDARLGGDDARVKALGAQMQARLDAAMAKAAGLLDDGRDLEAAARALVGVRYFRRFLDEVEVHADANDAAVGGGGLR